MGSVYQEPGYSALDSNGKNLTDQVQVSGAVDHMTAGAYIITYTVTDDVGRTATVQRQVVVEPAKQPEVVNPDGKVIYLTFDDGPRSGKIERLLEILDKYNVKVTFFVQGSNANLGENLKAIADAGHSIGIHTVTHDYKTIYANEEAFLKDLYGMQAIIQEHTGITTTLMRFPGGSSNTRSDNKCDMKQLVRTVTNLGFQYFDCNVDSDDAGGANTAEEVYQNVINGIGSKKVACVLMHDTKGYTVDAVERIIQWALANGYTLMPLSSDSPGFHHLEVK
jgi:peptidoglycan/xylan/chitin deacetylase (PgdA/CDA1 family)